MTLKMKSNRFMNILLSILLFALTSTAAHAGKTADYYKSPSRILADIKKNGPDRVLHSLTGPASAYVMDKIASGESAWLEVGRQLSKTSDVGESESLSEITSMAIGNHARDVLTYNHFDAETYCDGEDIEKDDRYRTINDYDKAFRERIKKVERVTDKALQNNRSQCLNLLRKRQVELHEALTKMNRH